MKEVLSTIGKFTIDSKKLDESLKPLKSYLEAFRMKIVPMSYNGTNESPEKTVNAVYEGFIRFGPSEQNMMLAILINKLKEDHLSRIKEIDSECKVKEDQRHFAYEAREEFVRLISGGLLEPTLRIPATFGTDEE